MKVQNKFLLIPICIFLLLFVVSATQTSLGTFKSNSNVNLIQTCQASTYSNVTRVVLPDGTLALDGQYGMTISGENFNYTFSNTVQLGTYFVYGTCDENLVPTSWQYDFNITTYGSNLGIGLWILIILLAYGLVIFGLWKEDLPLTMLGTFALYGLGLYMMFYGLGSVKDSMTNIFAWVTLGIAFYLSVRVGIEYIQETYNGID